MLQKYFNGLQKISEKLFFQNDSIINGISFSYS